MPGKQIYFLSRNWEGISKYKTQNLIWGKDVHHQEKQRPDDSFLDDGSNTEWKKMQCGSAISNKHRIN